jgi:hypothetical protein
VREWCYPGPTRNYSRGGNSIDMSSAHRGSASPTGSLASRKKYSATIRHDWEAEVVVTEHSAYEAD